MSYLYLLQHDLSHAAHQYMRKGEVRPFSLVSCLTFSKGKNFKKSRFNIIYSFGNKNKKEETNIEWFQVDIEEDVEAGVREATLRSLDREVPGLSAVRAEVKRLRSGHD